MPLAWVINSIFDIFDWYFRSNFIRESMAASGLQSGEIAVEGQFTSHRNSNGRFEIKWTDFKKPGPAGLFKFIREGTKAVIPNKEELDKNLPIKKPDFSALELEEVKKGVWVTWLGHACVFLQMDGMCILTDPVFSTKCGPSFGFQLGVTRYRDSPCQVADLSKLDAVVISHNHYDHLDVQTVKCLNEKFPKLTWFVPEGVRGWMKSIGCQDVVESLWWHWHMKDDVKFIFVPAQHWSKRGVNDDNKTLWGGWCIKGPSHSFYFAGDTGYHEGLFKEIGKLGPFDLAAIPIGAYSPRWFMQCQHIDPEEALKIHSDVKAKKSIGIHWATFNLSNEPYLDPRNEIQRRQKEKGETEDFNFFTVNLGESKLIEG